MPCTEMCEVLVVQGDIALHLKQLERWQKQSQITP